MPKPERVLSKEACFFFNKIKGLTPPRHYTDSGYLDDNDYHYHYQQVMGYQVENDYHLHKDCSTLQDNGLAR